MFGKKKDNAPVPVGAAAAVCKESSLIAQDCLIEGALQSNGDVRIDGRVTGTIRVAGNLTLSDTADVSADIYAKNVKIAGELHGNIRAEELAELAASARVYGDIATGALKVERGARFVGSSLGQYIAPAIADDGAAPELPPPKAEEAGKDR
ncbi:MAG: polymer-forming cytoskeletal protein [Gracilibacteraceae bacterium]|jgi:cytoskeletal protein CcmA (bactofilin family)|nr:polymer-forming cytoskeletal protein [Gracilibacteraceae bacterium]